MQVKLKDVKPNPYRHTERYPLDKEKIEALKSSILNTEFWDNIVARKAPGGKVEIAYGHHRLAALREMYEPEHEIDLIIKPWGEDQMIKAMANENSATYHTSADILTETVRAVVEALAAGKLSEFPKVKKKRGNDRIMMAPHFKYLPNFPENLVNAYSQQALVDYLGWPLSRVVATLSALSAEEDGLLDAEDLRGVGQRVAEEVSREARTTKTVRMSEGATEKQAVTEARRMVKTLTKEVRAGETPLHKVRLRAAVIRDKERPKKAKEMPELHEAAEKMASYIEKFLSASQDTTNRGKLDEIAKFASEMRALPRRDLAKTIEHKITYLQSVLNKLNGATK